MDTGASPEMLKSQHNSIIDKCREENERLNALYTEIRNWYETMRYADTGMTGEEYEQLFSLVSAFEDGENGFILAINALNEIAKLKKTDAEGEDAG